jgi:hypothetical protein
MARKYRVFNDRGDDITDLTDDDPILRDGQRLRVPLFLQDGASTLGSTICSEPLRLTLPHAASTTRGSKP